MSADLNFLIIAEKFSCCFNGFLQETRSPALNSASIQAPSSSCAGDAFLRIRTANCLQFLRRGSFEAC